MSWSWFSWAASNTTSKSQAAAVCLDNLGIEEVILPILYEGTGTIRCAHGVLPIPVPAVVNIAAAEHLNLHITGAKGEYVTPTGAASRSIT